MPVDRAAVLARLRAFQFSELFTQELGWDWFAASSKVAVAKADITLQGVAEKRGVRIFHCPPGADGRIPEATFCDAVSRQVSKIAREHLLIFTDAAHAEQLWLYPRREPGKPVRSVRYRFAAGSANELLLQKLSAITFSLNEEEGLNLLGVTQRLKDALDRDVVTKSFYKRFEKERDAFQVFLEGIPDVNLERWYVAVMLNRLMFLYFIQEKGFLGQAKGSLGNGDPRYLQNHLAACAGNYYRDFLCPLFFEGLAQEQRLPAILAKLGRVPYLNGGIFERHEIERAHGRTIQIPNGAFVRLFGFFDDWNWHLDDRPIASGKEINPEILGYIFEKFINQKQMGAYYTKEDITEYIGKNTILPYILDAARAKCKVAFEPGGTGISPVWDLLRADPDRYIYPAVRHGVDLPLPPEIEAGVNPPTLRDPVGDGPVATLEARKGWNKPAPPAYALPTETWREIVARRQRCNNLKSTISNPQSQLDANTLVTLNLDIRQFVQDVVVQCEGPDLLRAIWGAVSTVTILDPTCGSGAFLFAALNLLEPLYEACLDRMETFLQDEAAKHSRARPPVTAHGYPILPHKKFEDFTALLERVAAHSNRRYFVLKSIILNNLYGVDIMEEAVEICKLRLFLTLAAQVEPDPSKPNLGIEPLPDMDFNIRAGNTLVGYATPDEVRKCMTELSGGQMKLLDEDELSSYQRFDTLCADVQQAFDAFRRNQTAGDDAVPEVDKRELQRRLAGLDNELNRHLAGDYNVKPTDKAVYAKWLASHQPFHWFIHFYGIIARGGFDVIIGNPPWKEYSAAKKSYTVRDYVTEPSGNLYALCTERSVVLLAPKGFLGFIVQLPIVSSPRMDTTRGFLNRSASFIAALTCDDRPGKLFDGLQHCRSTILLLQQGAGAALPQLWSSGYRRWATEVRDALFQLTTFTEADCESLLQAQFPKVVSPLHISAYARLLAKRNRPLGLTASCRTTDDTVFYQESAQYWVKATVGVPYYAKNGVVGAPAHGRHIYFDDETGAKIAFAVLNSSLFYTYHVTYGDCFHVSDTLATGFPLPPTALENTFLASRATNLMLSLESNAQRKTIRTKGDDTIAYAEFRVAESKPILDEIDTILAKHYGFTEEELDFIINYDIKYRMGRYSGEEEE